LCNDSNLEVKNGKWEVVGDPTEGALIAAANKAGLTQEGLEMPRLDSIPFESQFQYMATLHEGSGKKGNSVRTIYVKGSVETILNRCQQMLDTAGQPIPVNREQIEQQVNNLAR
jgi:Ca2+-transporting ATPase